GRWRPDDASAPGFLPLWPRPSYPADCSIAPMLCARECICTTWPPKNGSGSERRDLNPLPALEGRLVRTNPDHRPVDARRRVRHRRLLAQTRHQEVVGQVRVAAAVAAALDEAQVLRVLDR